MLKCTMLWALTLSQKLSAILSITSLLMFHRNSTSFNVLARSQGEMLNGH